MLIGERIKLLRKSKNLTQKAFANQLYISFQSVSNWERNVSQPTMEILLEIIDKYDLTLDYFIDRQHTFEENKLKGKIVEAFFEAIETNQDVIPSLNTVSQFCEMPLIEIKTYFPSFSDLMYYAINKIDSNIQLTVKNKVAKKKDIMDVFLYDVTPLLYEKKEILYLLYTRTYTNGVWTKMIKIKYKKILMSRLKLLDNKSMDVEFFIETLTAFVSVWLSQQIPDPLDVFQKKVNFLIKNNMNMWLM